MKKLYFSFGCDCEATQSSIADPELGYRATSGLGEIYQKEGIKGTFFVIPSDIGAHASLYHQLEAEGHEVGMHLHPAELGYQEFCGLYGADEQTEIIDSARSQFEEAFGRHPGSFCMGYASANDHTFPVLDKLGFTHGMCSIPTRVLPECAAVWAGAPLDMHYAHAHNRLLRGDLNFVNIPNTVDPDSRLWGGKHPQDLRVELVDAKNHWYTIDKAIRRQLADNAAIVYIQATTHNTFDFSATGNFRRETAFGIIRAARQLAEQHGLVFEPVTTGELAAAFRAACPSTQSANAFELDTRGRAFLSESLTAS